MAHLRIESINPFTPRQRVAETRNDIFNMIDDRLASFEKSAEKYQPGCLNRSYIDGELDGLRYARRIVEGFMCDDLLDITYKK